VACGVSAISAVGMTYSQNAKTLESYYDALDRNELPITRGIKFGMDDALRRLVIQMLMCNFELSISSIEQGYPITFMDYFASEVRALRELEKDGLLTLDQDWLCVTAKGRLLIRNICMAFDRYLQSAPSTVRYSKTN
jgi:oxygen-independent coproporphyrinogen-3 oxidase